MFPIHCELMDLESRFRRLSVQHNSPTLTATLTSDGAPLAGETIRFMIRGRAAGKATTDDQGIATLTSGAVRGLGVGKYPRTVVAVFAGDSGHRAATGRGAHGQSIWGPLELRLSRRRIRWQRHDRSGPHRQRRLPCPANATLDTTNAMLMGVLPGDLVMLDTTNAIGTFDSPDVGTNKTVFITARSGGVRLDGVRRELVTAHGACLLR